MSVTLPSDLVADVMRNADPARRSAAVGRLTSAAGAAGQTFASAIDGVQAASAFAADSAPEEVQVPTSTSSPGSGGLAAKSGTYQGFERMVLRNLFETLLPSEQSGTFGGGPSAGVWRSMAADQLAGVYAKNGGIGIAKMLEGAAHGSTPRRSAEWPYFSMGSIGALTGQPTS